MVAVFTTAVLVGVPLTRAMAAVPAGTGGHFLFIDCEGPSDTQGEVLFPNVTNAALCEADLMPSAAGTIQWTSDKGNFADGHHNTCTLDASVTPAECSIEFNTEGTLGNGRITAVWSGGASEGEEVLIANSICPPTCGSQATGGTLNNTSTTLSCGAAVLGTADSCTATVTDLGGGSFTKSPPTGTVSFSGGTGSFSAPSCTLGSPNTSTFSSSCPVNFTPSAQGAMTLSATYGGGSQWNGSVGTASLNVAPSSGTSGRLQPDGLIRRMVKGATFLGNNVYNGTGNHQTVRAHAGRGKSRAFQIKIQNDGTTKDQIFVSVPGQRPPGFRLRYFQGNTDVTAKVANHTFQSPVLAPGATSTLRVVVTVLSKAPLNTVRAWYVDIRSAGNPTKRDVVKFKIFTPRA